MAVIDILQIAKEAEAKKQKDARVINATIGMFYDEHRHVGGIPIVLDRIHHMPAIDMLPYPAVDGGPLFKNQVIDWVFGEYKDVLLKHFYVDVCATPGGSGAIATTFSVYGKTDDHIFVSDIRWQYDRFAARANMHLFEHHTFIDDHFDIQSFKQRLAVLCQKQQRVIVVINDPCHNPTGYTLSMEEWDEIIASLNAFPNNDIVFLYDLAYLEFSHEKNSRTKLSKLVNLNQHVKVVIAFSGSKTFGVYGLRLGAAIGLSKTKSDIEYFYNRFVEEARGSWSATPTIALSLFNFFAKKEQKKLFLDALNEAKHIVEKRSQVFREEAQKVGLDTYPFRSGFYTIVKTDDPMDSFNKLKTNGIYTIPMAHGIRVALCSITLQEVKGLASRMKHILSV